MTYDRSKSGLDELQGLLETFGADRERWPLAARARTEMVIGADRQAARMLAEAKALDAVLAHAPLPAPDRRAALADRILAGARASAPEKAGRPAERLPSAVVIPWPGQARRGKPGQAAATGSASWRAAALLAASLALGVFVGALDLVPDAVDPLMDVVVYNSDLDQTAAILNEGLAAAFDEEFL
jgi:hypothetical protein